MKNIIFVSAIVLGLMLTVSAQSRGDRHSDGHNDRGGYSGHDQRGTDNRGYDRCEDSRRSNHYYSSNGYYSSGRCTAQTTVSVWVPGYTSRVWCPPRFEYVRQHCGNLVQVCVSPGHYDTQYVPGYYRYETVRSTCYNSCCRPSGGVTVHWRF